MKILNINSTTQFYKHSFEAKKLSDYDIQRVYPDGSKESIKADFIEFDRDNVHDRALFEDIYTNSDIHKGDDDYLTEEILYDFLNRSSISDKNGHFYALSKKQENYNNIDKNALLGMVQVHSSNHGNPLWIDDIQSFDDSMYANSERKYSDVGKSMLNGLVDEYKQDIECESTDEAIGFYKKYGFEEVNNSIIPNHMRYSYLKHHNS